LIRPTLSPQFHSWQAGWADANAAFTKHTGLVEPVGRTFSEILSVYNEQCFEFYGNVARPGEAKRFSTFSKALGRHFEAFAFRRYWFWM
jgi:hypothetical protein